MVLGVLGGTLSGTHNAVDVADVALIGGGNWNIGTQLTNAGDVDADGYADFWIMDYQQMHLYRQHLCCRIRNTDEWNI